MLNALHFRDFVHLHNWHISSYSIVDGEVSVFASENILINFFLFTLRWKSE